MLLRVAVVVGALLLSPAWLAADEYKSGIVWPEPAVVTPGEKPSDPPSDAITLFDGEDMSAWKNGDAWLVEDGIATAAKKGIQSKQKFGDVQLHLEWSAPEEVKGNGQGRGNSGIYFMGKYEVQILDSFENPTYFDGQAASIYKQTPPMVNAMKKPGEWNTYDIIFNAPKFDKDGKVLRPAHLTVLHNGVLVQNHFELQGGTFWDQPAHYEPHGEKGALSLQFHGNPVRFRNIWVREIAPIKPIDPAHAHAPHDDHHHDHADEAPKDAAAKMKKKEKGKKDTQKEDKKSDEATQEAAAE